MFRALLELGFTIFIIIIARTILTSVMKGFVNAGRQARSGGGAPLSKQPERPTGELHKDPVCGTFVAESTPFRRQLSDRTFYYCSADCKEKHALVAK
jgi:YHS domain-containing protein